MLKLMIHAPTEAALNRAQANARNLLKLEPDAQVQLVVNGPAMATAVTITDVQIRGLLVLCQNSLNAQQLEAPAGVMCVPAVIQHLAVQQSAGWSYVRA